MRVWQVDFFEKLIKIERKETDPLFRRNLSTTLYDSLQTTSKQIELIKTVEKNKK